MAMLAGVLEGGVVGIGGETTGYLLKVVPIELDPAGIEVGDWDAQQIRVQGTFSFKEWPIRGRVRVLRAHQIELASEHVPEKPDGDVILNGRLQTGIIAIGGETTGYRLEDAIVEIDMSAVPEADALHNRVVRVEGEFTLYGYVTRGPAWIFRASSAEPVDTERQELTVGERSEVTAPNDFMLEGDGLRIGYSTSSIAGVPQLSYQDGERELLFTGEEIRRADTELGTLVTVTLDYSPDFRWVTFTLILPWINLKGSERAFDTYGIRTSHFTTIGGTDWVTGPLADYEVAPLRGTARHVEF